MTARRWQFEGFSVECPIEVIQQISTAAREGFMRFPHGGVEIGGVLAGRREGDVLCIREARALAIEYARGASFSLTEADEADLRALAHQASPLAGWYVSHTRRDLSLSMEDTAIFDRFFGFDLSVCLVIKPAVAGSDTMALFVRDPDGIITEAAGYEDIEMNAQQPAVRSTSAVVAGSTEFPVAVAAAVAEEPAAPERLEPVLIETPPPRFTEGGNGPRKWYPAAIAAAIGLVAIPGAMYLRQRPVEPQHATPPGTKEFGVRNREPAPDTAATEPVNASPKAVQEGTRTEPKKVVKAASRTKAKQSRTRRARARHRR